MNPYPIAGRRVRIVGAHIDSTSDVHGWFFDYDKVIDEDTGEDLTGNLDHLPEFFAALREEAESYEAWKRGDD